MQHTLNERSHSKSSETNVERSPITTSEPEKGERERRVFRNTPRNINFSVDALTFCPELPCPPPPKPVGPFMTVADYAKYRTLSKRTIENLIREGMPVEGRKRDRRIRLADADAWIQTRSHSRNKIDEWVKVAAERITSRRGSGQ